MIGPHHSIIWRLISGGQGAPGVQGEAQRAEVVTLARLGGQAQQAHEHRRHELRRRDAVLGDQREDASASKRSITTTVAPHWWKPRQKRSGAAW